jgi:hypothetical protein
MIPFWTSSDLLTSLVVDDHLPVALLSFWLALEAVECAKTEGLVFLSSNSQIFPVVLFLLIQNLQELIRQQLRSKTILVKSDTEICKPQCRPSHCVSFKDLLTQSALNSCVELSLLDM